MAWRRKRKPFMIGLVVEDDTSVMLDSIGLIGRGFKVPTTCAFRNAIDYIWWQIKAVGFAIYGSLLKPIGKLLGLVGGKLHHLKPPPPLDNTGIDLNDKANKCCNS